MVVDIYWSLFSHWSLCILFHKAIGRLYFNFLVVEAVMTIVITIIYLTQSDRDKTGQVR